MTDSLQLLEQRHDLAERQAELFVEHDHQREHLRAELRRGGAEGVRGLERMPALHAPMAIGTPPHVDIELTDDHAGDRQFLLILAGHPGLDEGTRACRTLRRQRRLIGLRDRLGHAPMGLRAIPRARLPAWTLRLFPQRLGKRGGLSEAGASRLGELSPQMTDLLAKAFPLALPSIPFSS